MSRRIIQTFQDPTCVRVRSEVRLTLEGRRWTPRVESEVLLYEGTGLETKGYRVFLRTRGKSGKDGLITTQSPFVPFIYKEVDTPGTIVSGLVDPTPGPEGFGGRLRNKIITNLSLIYSLTRVVVNRVSSCKDW